MIPRPLLPLGLLLAAAATAFADDLGFTFENRTAATIEAIYLSTDGDKDWNANLLPDGRTIARGQQATIQFAKAPEETTWDVRVIDASGQSTTFADVKLANTETLALVTRDGAVQLSVE